MQLPTISLLFPIFLTSTTLARGNFYLSCTNHQLRFTVGDPKAEYGSHGGSLSALTATCKRNDGQSFKFSKLIVKQCVANEDGRLVFKKSSKGSTAFKTCKRCHLLNHTGTLKCECQKREMDPAGLHTLVDSTIALGAFVRNDDEQLTCN